MRQVRNRLVIRLEKELPDSHIAILNEEFPDMIRSGKIYKTSMLAEEVDEPDLRSKARITFFNNKKTDGRLNEMILKIDELSYSILPV